MVAILALPLVARLYTFQAEIQFLGNKIMSNNASSLPVFTVGFVTGANASSLGLPVLRLDVSEYEDEYIIPDRELELIKAALIESLKKAKEPSLTTVSFAVDIPPLPEKRRRKRRKKSNFSEYEPKSPQPEQKRRTRKTGKTSEDSSTTATSKSERRLDTDNHLSVFEVLEELIG